MFYWEFGASKEEEEDVQRARLGWVEDDGGGTGWSEADQRRSGQAAGAIVAVNF